MGAEARDAGLIQAAYWIVLGRTATPLEIDNQTSGQLNSDQLTLRHGLLGGHEFGALRAAWKAGRETHPDRSGLEQALRQLGSDEEFVGRVYQWVLGRHADESGGRHYAGLLASGTRRSDVVRALALSDEFERRFQAVPRDTQLCELANPAKWDNPEWLEMLRSLGLSDDKLAMHRKPYEFTQFLYGCRRLGVLREDAAFLSVGAGHELILYWLANHVRRVVATDMYEGVWQGLCAREGDPAVLHDPDQFAPFPYRRECLTFMKMDGRALEFEAGAFDVVYSLSSIEHFGGLDGAKQTIYEMARVLKPGGILGLATELVISGPPHEETFQSHEIAALVRHSGLELVEPIDELVYRRYTTTPVDALVNPYQAPHMLVRMNDTIFTSVMIFLRKA
jgi:SAM-dependent methyltransferase